MEGVVRVAVDGWGPALRRQLGLGRLLPLGEPTDGLWLAERAAVPVLEEAAGAVTGVRLGRVRLGPDDVEAAGEPAVPPPPSALPPGPLRIAAEFTADLAATAGEPLTGTAARLREALEQAASRRLGLPVVAVDLHVTALLDGHPPTGDTTPPESSPAAEPDHAAARTPTGRDAPGAPDASGSGDLVETVARAASSVPGALRVRPARSVPHPSWLAAAPPAKRGAPPGREPVSESGAGPEREPEPGAGPERRPEPDVRQPTGHLLLHLTVTADRRVADVAREVRDAVRSSLTGEAAPRTLAVLVTAVS